MSQTSAPTFVILPLMPFSCFTSRLWLLAFTAAASAFAAEDSEINQALEGLPPEVREHVRLIPPREAPFNLDAADPLKAAVYSATQIRGDDDLRNRCLYLAGKQALKQGRPALAEEIAEKCTDFRSVLLLAELAETLSPHDRAKAEEFWDQSARRVSQLKPWQSEFVANKLVVTGNAMDLPPAKVGLWFQSIRDPLNRFVTGAEIKAIEAQKSGRFEMGLYRSERQTISLQIPLPGLMDVASRLFDAGLTRYKSSSEAEKKQAPDLIRAGLEILAGSNVVHAEQVTALSKRLYQVGQKELAREAFEAIEHILGGPPEEVARLRFHMAALWEARGESKTIIPLLEKSEKESQLLESMYQPFAFAWIASAWIEIGDQERANVLNSKACEAAIANVNPRIGWQGLFEINLCHAATARALSREVSKILANKFNP